jgi:hypothetical protein
MIIEQLTNKSTIKRKCINVYFAHNNINYYYKIIDVGTIEIEHFFICKSRKRKIGNVIHNLEEFHIYHPDQSFVDDFHREFKKYKMILLKNKLKNILELYSENKI